MCTLTNSLQVGLTFCLSLCAHNPNFSLVRHRRRRRRFPTSPLKVAYPQTTDTPCSSLQLFLSLATARVLPVQSFPIVSLVVLCFLCHPIDVRKCVYRGSIRSDRVTEVPKMHRTYHVCLLFLPFHVCLICTTSLHRDEQIWLWNFVTRSSAIRRESANLT